MIEVENLVKKYGSFAAVKGISFTAQLGQVTGFLGPNGAGKTTTMRILTGYSPPTQGKATVAGYDVFEQSMDVRKSVGYLPENVPLYRDMSALGYLRYIGEIRGVQQAKSRAMDVLGQVGLAKRATNTIRTFSKGMKQRVGLAAALLHDPEVLILDEPTIGLDPIQVLELRDLISELGQNHTVIFSTHILSEAEQVCDRVVIINQGELIAQGEPTALRAELERGQRILVRVDGDQSSALEIVQNLDAIASATIERDAIVALPPSADIDPRPAITRALVNAGMNVLEVRPAANNLEEIFLELTHAQHAGDEDDAAEEKPAEAVATAYAATQEEASNEPQAVVADMNEPQDDNHDAATASETSDDPQAVVADMNEPQNDNDEESEA